MSERNWDRNWVLGVDLCTLPGACPWETGQSPQAPCQGQSHWGLCGPLPLPFLPPGWTASSQRAGMAPSANSKSESHKQLPSLTLRTFLDLCLVSASPLCSSCPLLFCPMLPADLTVFLSPFLCVRLCVPCHPPPPPCLPHPRRLPPSLVSRLLEAA